MSILGRFISNVRVICSDLELKLQVQQHNDILDHDEDFLARSRSVAPGTAVEQSPLEHHNNRHLYLKYYEQKVHAELGTSATSSGISLFAT
jgi:hypothetical protein